MSKILLRSCDDEMFEVDLDILQSFGAVKTMLDTGLKDDSGVIPLPKVSGQILRKILIYLDYHKLDLHWTADQILSKITVPEWDVQFFNGEKVTIFEIIEAANYLDIKLLMQNACMYVANFILKDKSPAQMQNIFLIRNDLPTTTPSNDSLHGIESLPSDSTSEELEN